MSVPNTNEIKNLTGDNFDDNMSLNATPNVHDITTDILEVDPREQIQLVLYFTLFCYVFSIYFYICMHTPFSTIGSIHDRHSITFTGISNINDKNLDPYKLLKSIKVSNINRLIIGQLNINSLSNKLKHLN